MNAYKIGFSAPIGHAPLLASGGAEAILPGLKASRFLTPITWEEVANERSTEKLIQLCKEKIAPPQNFLLRAIIMGQKDWVEPLVACGAFPEESYDYLTPALAWMSRYPKEPLPPSLQSTPYEREIIERKVLGHLFELEGDTKVYDQIIPLENFPPTFFWSRITDLTKELGNRNQTLSKINRFSLFEKAVDLSDREEIDFKESPFHIIKTGYTGYAGDRAAPGHTSALVLSENFIAHVNNGVSVGRYRSDLLPANVKSLLSFSSLTDETYKTAMASLYKEIQASPISKNLFLKKRPLTQLVGNCSWKTPEASLFAVRLLDTLESLEAEGKKTAQEILIKCLEAAKEPDANLRCENDAKQYVIRFVENRGSVAVHGLLQDHQHLVKKMKEFVLENYQLYRNRLSDETKQQLPIDSDLMMKIAHQFPPNIIPPQIIPDR